MSLTFQNDSHFQTTVETVVLQKAALITVKIFAVYSTSLSGKRLTMLVQQFLKFSISNFVEILLQGLKCFAFSFLKIVPVPAI